MGEKGKMKEIKATIIEELGNNSIF